MRLTREELKRLALPVLLALALAGAGFGLTRWADKERRTAQQKLAAVQNERQQNTDRLARIAEEEREVKEKIEVYKQLRQLNILGEERRLEWADAMTRIRKERELLDLRYRVERQRLMVSMPGKPAPVDFFASTMKVEMSLLHEEDLLRFLSDLRNSGNAYYSVQRCGLTRTVQSGAPLTTVAPRLRADCDIDLITVIDRGAKG